MRLCCRCGSPSPLRERAGVRGEHAALLLMAFSLSLEGEGRGEGEHAALLPMWFSLSLEGEGRGEGGTCGSVVGSVHLTFIASLSHLHR